MSVCTEPGCPAAESGREFKNLRFHMIAKHKANAGLCTDCVPPVEVDNLPVHRARAHPSTAAPASNPSDPGGAGAAADPLPFADDTERAPRFGGASSPPPPPSSSKRGRLRDKVRGKLWGAADDAATGAPDGGGYETPPSRERRPRTGAKRANAGPILSLLWGGTGTLLERSGADVPVGRTLQFQAPAAGDLLDRLVANTWLDRVLQPLASKADDVEAVGALLAMPVLVAMVERSPALAVTLEPVLREVVAANLLNMAPVVKKKKADEKKLHDIVAELDPELGAADDPVGMMLAAIFTPPPEREPAADVHANGQGEPAHAPAG